MTELRVIVPDEVAERLANEAAEQGTSAENLAADLLRRHVPSTRRASLSFIGMFEGTPNGVSVAELEEQLEDGSDNGFGR